MRTHSIYAAVHWFGTGPITEALRFYHRRQHHEEMIWQKRINTNKMNHDEIFVLFFGHLFSEDDIT